MYFELEIMGVAPQDLRIASYVAVAAASCSAVLLVQGERGAFGKQAQHR